MAGIDVIVVKRENDEVTSFVSSEFHVSFYNPLVEDSIVSLLGLHQRRSLPSQGTTAFHSVFHVNNNAQDEYHIPTRYHNVAPEWVDIFCNDDKVNDVLAFVGPDDFLLFLDHTVSNGSAVFTKTPSSSILQLFPLRMGHNSIVCRTRGMYSTQVDFSMWLFASDAKFVVFDVDGTITKSDVRGIAETVYGGVYSYTHDGVIPFLQSLTQSLHIHVLYLTARSLTHMNETRAFLSSARDATNGESLPLGPILCNPERLMKAFYREVMLNNNSPIKLLSYSCLTNHRCIYIYCFGCLFLGCLYR